jgi:DNA-binding IclR family transcriptional regulator
LRVQSLRRAFALLEQVTIKQQSSLAELSKEVGLKKTTAHNLLKTLVELGYLDQERRSRLYCLGSRVFVLASRHMSLVTLVAKARPFLVSLTRRTQLTSNLAIYDGGHVVLLDRAEGPSPVQLSGSLGRAMPAHATALGKVLLAHLPPEELEAVLSRSELRRFTQNTIVSKSGLSREFRIISEQGFGVDQDEFELGLRCVAAPVWGFTGRVVGAIGVCDPSTKEFRGRSGETKLKEITSAVTETAAALSGELGVRVPE